MTENRSKGPVERVALDSTVTLAEAPKDELQIDIVLPRDLPRPTESNTSSGIHYILFLDYFIDRDREDPIQKLFRAMMEKIARAELSLLQMQENVDPSVVPSSSYVVGLFHEDIQSFDQKGLAK